MEEQSYNRHARIVPAFHRFLLPLILIAIVCSIANLYRAFSAHQWRWAAAAILLLSIGMAFTALFARIFALKAQDRAIRAEENLRHFAMTGRLLDSRLTMKQIIGLRFASDEEFVTLARQAADESMTPDAIKRSVKRWRADQHRL